MAKEDVVSDRYLTSCKTTGKRQYTIKQDDWELLCERAAKTGLRPKMEIRFEHECVEIVIMSRDDFKEIDSSAEDY